MAESSSLARWRSLQQEHHPHCSVCGRGNPTGFGLEFRLLEDRAVEASFTCDERFQGYWNWLHGGAIAAILDGAMTNCLLASGLVAVTAELRVRFRRPLLTGSEATVRAWVTRSLGPLHLATAEIVYGGRVAASASGKFVEYVPPQAETQNREAGERPQRAATCACGDDAAVG